MCTHTCTCTSAGTLHRVRGLHAQPFSITPPCRQLYSIFRGCLGSEATKVYPAGGVLPASVSVLDVACLWRLYHILCIVNKSVSGSVE